MGELSVRGSRAIGCAVGDCCRGRLRRALGGGRAAGEMCRARLGKV